MRLAVGFRPLIGAALDTVGLRLSVWRSERHSAVFLFEKVASC